MYWLLYLLAWIGYGMPAYGFAVAMSQRGYPEAARRDAVLDRLAAAALVLGGPLGLVFIAIILTVRAVEGREFHGWML